MASLTWGAQAGIWPNTTTNIDHENAFNKATTDFDIFVDGARVRANVWYILLSETNLSAHLCEQIIIIIN